MTTRDRFVRTLTGQPVDRVPFIKLFGGTNATLPRWRRESPGIETRIDVELRFEGEYRGWQVAPVNLGLSQMGKPVIIEETSEHIVQRQGSGAVEIVQKGGDYHRRTVEFAVKNRDDWRRVKAKHLQADDPDRFPKDWPAQVARFRNRECPLQLTHAGVYGFPRRLMGDEALAYAFYDDPGLVQDVMESYTDMALAVWSKMVAEVEFDLIECWEDMAFRNGSIISPQTFREFMKPQYEKIAAFARQHGIPIILVDSDGFIEDLVPLMQESGVNAMYPFEVQSDNDVRRVREKFPTLGILGALDKESMARGRDAIDREIEKARRLISELGRYIPGPDHFVLSNVSYEDYRYFMERLREVVVTTRPASPPERR